MDTFKMIEIGCLECTKCSIKYEMCGIFHLTECGHILCGTCTRKIIVKGLCTVCNKKTSVYCLPKHDDVTSKIFIAAVNNILKGFIEAHNKEKQHWQNMLFRANDQITNMQKEIVCLRRYGVQVEAENKRLRDLINLLVTPRSGPPIIMTPITNIGQHGHLFYTFMNCSSVYVPKPVTPPDS